MTDNNQARLWADGKTVDVNGVVFAQRSTSSIDREIGTSSDPCYHCIAYSNMSLCDQICPYCKFGYVFVPKGKRSSII